MKKRVLVVHFSQTGQLTRVLNKALSPLRDARHIELVEARIQSSENFKFPWDTIKFFDAFPETVYLDPPQNMPLKIEDEESFDLIILGYQPWFLSPSMPMSAFMLSYQAKKILNAKPVITIIGCRNMWIEAQKTMKELIGDCNARLIDNVVLIDQSGPIESLITTPRWMLTGKKDAFWGLSAAGIKDENINASSRFGERLCEKLKGEITDEPMLSNLGAVVADARFVATEKIAKRSFRIWGALIRLLGKRGSKARVPVVIIYVIFLFLLIITVVPINMAIQTIIRRLFKAKVAKMLLNIEKPSGR